MQTSDAADGAEAVRGAAAAGAEAFPAKGRFGSGSG